MTAADKILTNLKQSGQMSIRQIVKGLRIHYPTARRAIQRLRAKGYQIKTTTTYSKGEPVTAYRLTRKTPVKNYATLNLA